MTDSVDLGAYPSGSIGVSWDQDESGDLELGDELKFAFSGDGGDTWSADIEAFSDDIVYVWPDTAPRSLHLHSSG